MSNTAGTTTHETTDRNDSIAGNGSISSSSFVYDAVQIIRTRRLREREHTTEEIEWWINEFTNGKIPDYQMSAWLMAVCLNGLSSIETATLTRCMVQSGSQLQWKQLQEQRRYQQQQQQQKKQKVETDKMDYYYFVDKHSTGGVGDKVSIVLAPLVAAMGKGKIKVPMIAGRGLGHTGGTIDKLQSIPNFNATLSIEKFQSILLNDDTNDKCSCSCCAITAATNELCPADQKLYALRDVTDTVSSIPLQTASIMSKKIAENPDSIVLDVKYGPGSFQSTVKEAEVLAKSMIVTGEANGVQPTTAFLTRMDEPIGDSVGNWLEIEECIRIMTPSNYPTGRLSEDPNNNPLRLSHTLIQLILVQATQMIQQANLVCYKDMSFTELMKECYNALQDGHTLHEFREMVLAQGGDVTYIDSPETYPLLTAQTTTTIKVCAQQSGYITQINSLMIGQVCVTLGAGRKVATDCIDPIAGIRFFKQVGDSVTIDDDLALIYVSIDSVSSTDSLSNNSRVIDKAKQQILQSIRIEQLEQPPVLVPIVSHIVTSADGMQPFTIPSIF